jgi:hypothetical protein
MRQGGTAAGGLGVVTPGRQPVSGEARAEHFRSLNGTIDEGYVSATSGLSWPSDAGHDMRIRRDREANDFAAISLHTPEQRVCRGKRRAESKPQPGHTSSTTHFIRNRFRAAQVW